MANEEVKVKLGLNVSEFMRDLAQAAAKVESFAQAAARSVEKLRAHFFSLQSAIGGIITGYAVNVIKNYITEVTHLSGRYEQLGLTMKVAGANIGFTSTHMDYFEKQLRKTGIAAIEARTTLTQMAATNMDLTRSAELARAAQNLAVVANINSSEAFERLTHGIIAQQPLILRTLGLQVDFAKAQEKLAAQLGVTSSSLNEQQEQLAATNAVLDAARNYTGLYEMSMKSAEKQFRTLERYVADFKVAMGEAFQPAFLTTVVAQTNAYKRMTDMFADPKLRESIMDLADTFADMYEGIVTGASKWLEQQAKLKAAGIRNDLDAITEGASLLLTVAQGFISVLSSTPAMTTAGLIGYFLFGAGPLGNILLILAGVSAWIEVFKQLGITGGKVEGITGGIQQDLQKKYEDSKKLFEIAVKGAKPGEDEIWIDGSVYSVAALKENMTRNFKALSREQSVLAEQAKQQSEREAQEKSFAEGQYGVYEAPQSKFGLVPGITNAAMKEAAIKAQLSYAKLTVDAKKYAYAQYEDEMRQAEKRWLEMQKPGPGESPVGMPAIFGKEAKLKLNQAIQDAEMALGEYSLKTQEEMEKMTGVTLEFGKADLAMWHLKKQRELDRLNLTGDVKKSIQEMIDLQYKLKESTSTTDWLMQYDEFVALNSTAHQEHLKKWQEDEKDNEKKIYEWAQKYSEDYARGYKAMMEEQTQLSRDTAAEITSAFGDAFLGMIMGTESVTQSFSKMAQNILQYLAQVAIKIAILKPLEKAMGTGLQGLIDKFMGPRQTEPYVPGYGAYEAPLSYPNVGSVATYHHGGEVGFGGVQRNLPSSLFLNAPRLHSGLAADEYPAVLQKGETVTPKGGPSVQIIIKNETGQAADAKESSPMRWDGDKWVTEIVMRKLATSATFRSAIRSA